MTTKKKPGPFDHPDAMFESHAAFVKWLGRDITRQPLDPTRGGIPYETMIAPGISFDCTRAEFVRINRERERRRILAELRTPADTASTDTTPETETP